MKRTFLRYTLPLAAVLFTTTISVQSCKDKKINIFSLNDDIELGKQVSEEIAANPQEYPLLDPNKYSAAYAHLQRITDNILNSGQVQYKDKFAWETHIINDDSTLNAFCTPGGYIYVYTGLIKYLESEDELAGVMGHEIAHADRRHSTNAMTRQYGIQLLLDIVFGQDKGALARVAVELKELQYSRDAEREADKYSVIYLYPTDYDARGAARFFEKLLANGNSGGPQFLSTHPNPENRVENITKEWETLGGKEGQRFVERYQQFKNALP